MRITAKTYFLQIGSLFQVALATILLAAVCCAAFGQTPSASPTSDKRGIGIESTSAANDSKAGQQSREAKPELVLQTGYNNFFGATRLVFSPDGRLLATATGHFQRRPDRMVLYTFLPRRRAIRRRWKPPNLVTGY